MQRRSRGEPVKESLSKPILLGLITAIVISVAVPLIVPHLAHPSMIYHIILHIAGLTVAIFLGSVSTLAYARSTSSRLLFMTLGFVALAVVEFLYLLDAAWVGGSSSIIDISAVGIELPHLILLVMLTLFALGVLRVSK